METLNLSTCEDSGNNTKKSEGKKIMCHKSHAYCFLSPVGRPTLHAASTAIKSPRILGDAAVGGLMIDRVEINTFSLKINNFCKFLFRNEGKNLFD